MNIQDKMQEIHHKYGVTEKANYEIQLFVEALLREQKEQLILSGVSVSILPTDVDIKTEAKKHAGWDDGTTYQSSMYGFESGAKWMRNKIK